MEIFIALPALSPAAESAKSLITGLNSQILERAGAHRRFFTDFWKTYTVTPDEILLELGTKASLVLLAAQENIRHLGNLAAMVGKSVEDFLSTEDREPPRAFILHEDGTVTLAPPAEGFDAWGREIVVP